MQISPRVTIILVNWNGERFLSRFLPALFKTEYPAYEILLVDNASKDNSVRWVREQFPSIQIIENDKNYGFAEGNNRALGYVTTPYIVLLNTDVEVTPSWLGPLVAFAEKHPLAAAVQPKIRAYHEKEYFEYAGAAGGYVDKYGYPFCRGRIFDTLERDEGNYETAEEVFWASGACLLIRTEVPQKIGLFDARFFAHWEEIDFCWRAKNAGYQIFCEPAGLVYHVGGGTLPKDNGLKVYLNFRNSLLTLLKNLPFAEALRRIFIRMCLDFVAAAKGAASGNLRYGWAIFRSHLGFYRRAPYYLLRSGAPKNPLLSLSCVYRASVVWEYYARNVKKFSELKKEYFTTRN